MFWMAQRSNNYLKYMTIHNYASHIVALGAILIGSNGFSQNADKKPISYVNCMIGTGGDANLLPVASVPFGMVQIGADTHLNNSGYKYTAHEIIGFSQTHMSGGGCNDLKISCFFLYQILPGLAVLNILTKFQVRFHTARSRLNLDFIK